MVCPLVLVVSGCLGARYVARPVMITDSGVAASRRRGVALNVSSGAMGNEDGPSSG